MDYLPKAQARRLYQFAQGKEEEMGEYRRQRDLEDKRAAAGGGRYYRQHGKSTRSYNYS